MLSGHQRGTTLPGPFFGAHRSTAFFVKDGKCNDDFYEVEIGVDGFVTQQKHPFLRRSPAALEITQPKGNNVTNSHQLVSTLYE